MQLGIIGVRREQYAICGFREIIFSGTGVKVGNFALRVCVGPDPVSAPFAVPR